MEKDQQEKRLDVRLTMVAKRIQQIADIEAQAALTGGYGARGEMMDEKLRLIKKADRIIDQFEKLAYSPSDSENQDDPTGSVGVPVRVGGGAP